MELNQKSYDVVIIGAGLAGLMSAIALRDHGLSVLVLEAHSSTQSASAGLVGALAPHMPEHWNEKKEYQFQSMQMAEGFWRNIEELTGLETGYRRLGRLQAIRNQAELDKANMREMAAKISWRGWAHWRVDHDALHPFRSNGLGVVYDDLSAQIYPQKAMGALTEAAQKSGVDLREHCPVSDFGKGYVCADKRYDCKFVVVAGGYAAWPFLRRYFGAEFGEGIKGQAALIELSEDWPYPMITGDGYYVVPHNARWLGLGSTSERYWSHGGVDQKLGALIARIEEEIKLPRFAIRARWAGIRPRAYRPDPLIGKVEAGVFVNAGGFKTGFSFMNKLSNDLALLVLGHNCVIPPKFNAANHLQ